MSDVDDTTGHDPQQGAQGVQGVQGIQGIDGRTVTGAKGEPGVPGATGQTGKMLPASITRSFTAVVVVCFLVLVVEAWQINRTSSIAHSNNVLIRKVNQDAATISQLRASQRQACVDFTTLKNAVNDFHGVIKGTLVAERKRAKVTAATSSNPSSKKAAADSLPVLDNLIAKTHTVAAKCAQHVTSKPNH